MRLTYTLTVEVPDTIDADTRAEILEAAEPYERDDQAACVERWLGDRICRAEEDMSRELPDGWNVWIDAQ
jgi:hypothetical protein